MKWILALIVLALLIFWLFGSPEVMLEERMPKAFQLSTPTPKPKPAAEKQPKIEAAVITGAVPSCARCTAWTLDGQEVLVTRWEIKGDKVVADVKDLKGNPIYGTALVDPVQWRPLSDTTQTTATSESAPTPSPTSEPTSTPDAKPSTLVAPTPEDVAASMEAENEKRIPGQAVLGELGDGWVLIIAFLILFALVGAKRTLRAPVAVFKALDGLVRK